MRALDLDGDGLHDLAFVQGTSTWRVRMSRGTSLGPTINTGITSANAARVMIADFDGDGRDDLIRPDGNAYQVHRSNGANLQSTPTYTLASSGASTAVALMADLSGSGFPEIVRVSGSTWHTHKHNSLLPDVVTIFQDGLEFRNSVVYQSLANTASYTLSWAAGENPPSIQYRRFRGPRYVVTTAVADTGVGTGTRQYQYHYETAWINVAGRGWSSFKSQRVNDVAQGVYRRSTFSRAFPYTGMTEPPCTTHSARSVR
jgi:hypothetical protein